MKEPKAEVENNPSKSNLKEPRDAKTVVDETIKYIEKLCDRKDMITGIASGYKKFDEITAGLQGGNLIIVTGPPSMGKTAICVNMAEYMAIHEEKSVIFFSLEMSAMQIMLRMISSMAAISIHKIRTGFLSQKDWPKITVAANTLYTSKIHFDDSPAQTVLEISSKARSLKIDKGLDIIFIDDLQLIEGDGQSKNRVQEIAGIIRNLKRLARELDVPVVVISQLPYKVEIRRPQLADLREYIAIEQTADIICFVHREEYDSHENAESYGSAEIVIAKQRNGPIGDVPLVYRREFVRFDNPDIGHPGLRTD